MNRYATAGIIHLLPFAIFVGLFVCSLVFFNGTISPIFSCLVAITVALMLMPRHISFNKRIEIALQGSAHPTIIAMCYIYILSAVFTYTLKLIGGLDAAVQIGMRIIPESYLLPGFFTIVSLFATAIGSSMGAIAAFLPIGLGIAHKVQVDPAFMAGIVVGGAMLGDNLSIISDTTIAAVQTTHCSMKEKFSHNLRLVIPAFVFTFITLTILNGQGGYSLHALDITSIGYDHIVKTTPYMLIFVCAILGMDVIPVLLVGIIWAASIGISYRVLTFTRATGLLLEGFAHDSGGIQEVLILSLLVAALSHLVEYNGGISYILEKLSTRIKSERSAELHISLLIFLVNAAVAINTIAILITGPVAKKVGNAHGVSNARVATLIDIVACICQGILPYAPQLLLAASLAGVSTTAIMPYLYYQGYILVVLMITILCKSPII